MEKRKKYSPPRLELEGCAVERLLAMSDDEIEAALKGSGWTLYKRLGNGELVTLQEYRKMGLQANP